MFKRTRNQEPAASAPTSSSAGGTGPGELSRTTAAKFLLKRRCVKPPESAVPWAAPSRRDWCIDRLLPATPALIG